VALCCHCCNPVVFASVEPEAFTSTAPPRCQSFHEVLTIWTMLPDMVAPSLRMLLTDWGWPQLV